MSTVRDAITPYDGSLSRERERVIARGGLADLGETLNRRSVRVEAGRKANGLTG